MSSTLTCVAATISRSLVSMDSSLVGVSDEKDLIDGTTVVAAALVVVVRVGMVVRLAINRIEENMDEEGRRLKGVVVVCIDVGCFVWDN